MIFYLSLLFIPSFYALNLSFKNLKNNKLNLVNKISWNLFFLLLIIVFGLRFEIGADWETYLKIFNQSQKLNFLELIKFNVQVNDFSYILLNKFSFFLGTDIYGVNLFAGLIFLFGVFKFCERQINPWLSLALCVPYLIIVVGMGFTRQAIALGIILYALTFIFENKIFRFLFLVLLSSTFHDSAIIYILLLLVLFTRKILKQLIIFATIPICIFILLFFYFDVSSIIFDKVDYYYRVYFKHSYNSSGVYYRLTMLFTTSVFFLTFVLNRIKINNNEKNILIIMSIISIIFFILLFFINSNAVIDRLSIYLFPIYITTAGLIPQVFNKTKLSNIFITILILLLNSFTLLVWINFGNYADRWVPYNFIS